MIRTYLKIFTGMRTILRGWVEIFEYFHFACSIFSQQMWINLCIVNEFKQDKDQRSMDIETAKAMLHLLLGKQWIMYPEFAQFLQQSKYKVINKDQWCNILEFSRTITPDLSNYDVDGACKSFLHIQKISDRSLNFLINPNTFISFAGPVLLDEFVEWLRQKRNEISWSKFY